MACGCTCGREVLEFDTIIERVARRSSLSHTVRFSFPANFILQFLVLSLLVGVPLFTFHSSLGQLLGAGVMDMWRISPIFKVSPVRVANADDGRTNAPGKRGGRVYDVPAEERSRFFRKIKIITVPAHDHVSPLSPRHPRAHRNAFINA